MWTHSGPVIHLSGRVAPIVMLDLFVWKNKVAFGNFDGMDGLDDELSQLVRPYGLFLMFAPLSWASNTLLG